MPAAPLPGVGAGVGVGAAASVTLGTGMPVTTSEGAVLMLQRCGRAVARAWCEWAGSRQLVAVALQVASCSDPASCVSMPLHYIDVRSRASTLHLSSTSVAALQRQRCTPPASTALPCNTLDLPNQPHLDQASSAAGMSGSGRGNSSLSVTTSSWPAGVRRWPAAARNGAMAGGAGKGGEANIAGAARTSNLAVVTQKQHQAGRQAGRQINNSVPRTGVTNVEAASALSGQVTCQRGKAPVTHGVAARGAAWQAGAGSTG